MQLERLRLVNFRQHEDTEVVLGAGLTGIIGPNGSGKTTLLEAIAWALYGSQATRGKKETIRRRGAGSRAPVRVELDFVLGPHRYRVVRGLNTAELYQDNDPAPIALSLDAVTEKITRLLGMTREEFFNTYFTGQKQLAVMAGLSSADRAQFLSRVLGYERLKLAQERLRVRRTELRLRLQALEESLPSLEELDRAEAEARDRLEASRAAEAQARAAERAAQDRFAQAEPAWQEAQQVRDRMAALAADLRLAEHRVSDAREAFQQLDRRLVEANEARLKLESLQERLAPLDRLRRERRHLDDLAEGYSRRRTAAGQLEEARNALAAVLERVRRLPPAPALEAARERMEALGRRVQELGEAIEERRAAWVRDRTDAETRRGALRAQYQELKEQHERITQAGPDGVCPTCARPLGAEFSKVLELLDRQLEEVRFNGNFYKQRVEQLEHPPPELRELERERAEAEKAFQDATREYGSLQAQAREGPRLEAEQAQLEGRIRELEHVLRDAPDGYDHERHQEVRRLLEQLEPIALEAERFRYAAEQAGALVLQAEAAERELTEREARARAIREQLRALGYSEEAFAQARQAVEAARSAWNEAKIAVERTRAAVEAAEERMRWVAARRAERAQREAEAKRVAADVALYSELDRAFTDLRTTLNLQLRPDLSELASGFVRDLTNGRYSEIELDDNYEATLLEGGEPRQVISGGEEDIANLALRLAISQMIADRAGQPLSLLVLDEIFGSLDEEHRHAVLDLLRSLADRFPQVILITHIEAVREGFDRVIRVEFDAERGAARVRDEAPGALDGLAA
jgi:exonuclease SbcC